MNNIIIKKLEDTIFDSNKEALDRLNELGRNDIESEAYKDLADQVRSTCPCNCYFSTRKRYKVDVSYRYYYYSYSYHQGTKNIITTEREITGNGTGYIEKGSTSGTIDVVSKYVKYESTDNFDTSNGGIISTSCPDLTSNSSVNFSIRLSDDCKHWIFSYSPIWKGYYNMRSSGCYEGTLQSNQLTYYGDGNLTEEIYPEVTSAYPSGTMTLTYHGESNTTNYPFDNNDTGTTTIEATVTPLEDSVNTYNSINSLYNDLNNSLK